MAGRGTVHRGDNRVNAASLEGLADRGLLGLLPSSEEGYEVAIRSLSSEGGYLHVHGVAPAKDHASWAAGVVESLDSVDPGRCIDAGPAIRVKSHAPHWDHVGLDVSVS